jgi:hypothetical protein
MNSTRMLTLLFLVLLANTPELPAIARQSRVIVLGMGKNGVILRIK